MPLKPTTVDGSIQMSPMTIPLTISPSPDIECLYQFVYQSWLDSRVKVNLRAPLMGIEAGKNVWWMPNIGKIVQNMSAPLLAKIPQTPPGYPQPGSPMVLTDILRLGSCVVNVEEMKNSTVIGFTALANLLLPFTSPSVHIPARLPSLSLTVDLPSPNATESVPFAKLSTTPSLNTTEGLASIMLPIQGSLLPIQPQTVPPLTHLVSSYLSGHPTTIFISSEPSTDFPITVPPIRATFPGPVVRPKILRGVSIKDMKLTASPSGEELVASGTLFASFALPPEVDRLTKLVDVTKIWPDTLVFDGPPPPVVIPSPPSNFSFTRGGDAPPLPDPLPERAFARIRAPDWLMAQTLPPEGGNGGGKNAEERRVTARIVEAPLEVLPGREEEFTHFVKKILSSDGAGALAGVRGTSAIGIRIRGLHLPAPPREDPDDDEGEGDGDGGGDRRWRWRR
ncbi:hypothetical protein BS47DRAFT_644293 [Hydnum rufescens UP504]|uniref:Uncharacterized protein n=1 Tax=Hydnum rufescens UP504 TaxID=1448309 RepID=A0A9P6DZI8_9AGAM|nr:hypothetical protein BS47DRAFT_644293 [Hydnum rufescens UP504]